MFWWSKPSTKSGGGGGAPSPAASAGGGGAGGEVAVQKVFYSLVPKTPAVYGGGKLIKPESPEEDINKKADRFIRKTRLRLLGQHKSFRGLTGDEPAANAGQP
ncbi:hypothetical protein GUJ93_ZPchr0005g15479 [Zizania palustris]|uniref:Uncharacterized protein n=1 Tax=Zizania palustris TaxID=103762 RepID=A0A8J5VCL6_ZIZPA|nr:hypothetical protein GUJ93_ZPchr0005g15479 [Zizania palustris]